MHIIFHPIRCDDLAPLEAHVLQGRLIVCGEPVDMKSDTELPAHPYVVRANTEQVELLFPYSTAVAPDVDPVTIEADGVVLIRAGAAPAEG
jgi:hypothetical protein